MNYQEAKETCHVRSAIYRESQYGNKSTPAIMYGKNHSISLDERVPKELYSHNLVRKGGVNKRRK